MNPLTRVKIAKYGYMATAVAFAIFGIFFVLKDNPTSRKPWVLLGIMMIVYGVFRFVGYFSRDLYQLAFQYDLAFGILMMAIGVVLLFHVTASEDKITAIIGTLTLTDSLYKVQVALDTRRFGMNRWLIILVAAAAAAVCGMLLIVPPARDGGTVTTMLGLALMLEGILSLTVAISVIKISENQRFDTER